MSKYNTKIFAPQYIPTGGVDLSKDKLFDLTKFEELREKVENSNCSEFDKDFLLYAC